MNALTIAARRRTLIAAALFGAVASGLTALPAVADSLDPPRMSVRYGDLNVDSPEGAAVLYVRIQNAARNVCLQFGGRGLDTYAQREACIHKAILGAFAKANVPALYAEAPTRLVARRFVR